MNSKGFKGSLVGIEAISITGSMAEVRVQFVNPETRQVHATMRHSLPLSGEGADPKVQQATQSLLEALQGQIARMHFDDVPMLYQTPIQETARGIAESLQGEDDEPVSTPDDSDGPQETGI